MAEEQQQHHHHHHKHRKDGSSLFKERSLKAIARRRAFEKFLKIGMIILAIVMAFLVIAAYTIG